MILALSLDLRMLKLSNMKLRMTRYKKEILNSAEGEEYLYIVITHRSTLFTKNYF